MSETLFDFDYEPDEDAPAPATQAGKKAKAAHVWERDPYDFYVEPAVATAALLTVESFPGVSIDPCCGSGNIVRSMRAAGLMCHGRDIVPRAGQDPADWFLGRRDFLLDGLPEGARGYSNIISNPPFYSGKGTEQFIRQALKHARQKVAVFTDIKFLAGKARRLGLYAEHPPARVYVLSPRVSCPPGDVLEAGGKASGGTADWIWMVWDTTAPHTGTSMFLLGTDEV